MLLSVGFPKVELLSTSTPDKQFIFHCFSELDNIKKNLRFALKVPGKESSSTLQECLIIVGVWIKLSAKSTNFLWCSLRPSVLAGVGLEFNHLFGFGVLDAGAMVALAKEWKTVPARSVCIQYQIQVKVGLERFSISNFEILKNLELHCKIYLQQKNRKITFYPIKVLICSVLKLNYYVCITCISAVFLILFRYVNQLSYYQQITIGYSDCSF